MYKTLKEAKNIIDNNQFSYKYNSVYTFTTENIKGVMESIDVENKKILTVSSSGDHIFNMLLHGASDIDSYDINYLTKYYFYFKEAAIRILTYDEFLNFFFRLKRNLNKNDNKLFEKILLNIKDKDVRKFWKILYNDYGVEKLYYSNLFIPTHYTKKVYLVCNDYLNSETNYKILQDKLNDFNYTFVWLNVFEDLSNISDKSYDIIYLSNIFDKLYVKDELEYVKKIKSIIMELQQHLTENGILGVCYLYCYLDEYWDLLKYRNLSSSELRYQYFNDNFRYEYFNGINTIDSRIPKNRDAIMLMLKK